MKKFKAAQSKEGVCRLTDVEGQFVKCHILPQSLTRSETAGAPLIQSSHGSGLRKRWSSWYDQSIVTREGEDILSGIDDAAINALRKHKLIWSSWHEMPNFTDFGASDQGWSFREVRLGDSGSVLHLFAISVIWRAAVSSLVDMAHFKIPDELVNRCKIAILSKVQPPLELFPTSLIQLSTRGRRHNMTPTVDQKPEVRFDGQAPRVFSFVRLFFDGLIMHSHLDPSDFDELVGNKLILGATDALAMPAIHFEKSSQRDRMVTMANRSMPRGSK